MDDHMPELAEGMDLEATKEILIMLTCTYKYDYDPENDFRKSLLKSHLINLSKSVPFNVNGHLHFLMI